MKQNISVVLYEPQISENVGAIIRSCSCFGADLIIISPSAYILSTKQYKRAKMDYETNIEICITFQDFINKYKNHRKVLFTPHTTSTISQFQFIENDLLIFGRESDGVECYIAAEMDMLLSIPMRPTCRSLNLAASVTTVLLQAYAI